MFRACVQRFNVTENFKKFCKILGTKHYLIYGRVRRVSARIFQSCSLQPVREAVSYRGLFTAGWFGVREKHCSRLKIYDRLRASEQAASTSQSIYGRTVYADLYG